LQPHRIRRADRDDHRTFGSRRQHFLQDFSVAYRCIAAASDDLSFESVRVDSLFVVLQDIESNGANAFLYLGKRGLCRIA
jgi:hypothetical protein